MIAFEEIAEESRIWIYQSNKLLTPEEVATIESKGEEFIDSWTSHNQQMHASLKVFNDCFLVVAVDESTAPPSGCGIDKSVRFVQDIQQELGNSFFERTNVAYIDGKGNVQVAAKDEVVDLVSSNTINKDTLVYNNLITKKSELATIWKQKLSESWVGNLV